jgi:erythromycin esterase-like protein
LNESAHFGLEGRASDSTFWNACGPATRLATDSVVAWQGGRGASHAADAAVGVEMARLIQHQVSVGLRHLPREEINGEHVMFLADLVGRDAKLLLWGGDIELGRLSDGKITQTGVALGKRLGDRYRAIAFDAGGGSLRTRPIPTRSPFGQTGGNGEIGVGNTNIAAPSPESYEDVFNRSGQAAFYVDARTFPSDSAGAWLKGPRALRVISEPYSPLLPQGQFDTRVELPKYYDAIVFVKRVSPVRP